MLALALGVRSDGQDGGQTPKSRLCPDDFLTGYTAQFVVVGDGFQTGSTTVTLNGVVQADVVVISKKELIVTTSLPAGVSELAVTTPGGGSGGVPVVGRTLNDLNLEELFSCSLEVLKVFRGLNPSEASKDTISAFEPKIAEASVKATKEQFSTSITLTNSANRILSKKYDQGKISQRAVDAVAAILNVLISKLQDEKKKQDARKKAQELIKKYGNAGKKAEAFEKEASTTSLLR